MGGKSTLTAERRIQPVVGVVVNGKPAAQIARRAGISQLTPCAGHGEFIGAGKQAMYGRWGRSELGQDVERLWPAVGEHDHVVRELAVGNRDLRKLAGALS